MADIEFVVEVGPYGGTGGQPWRFRPYGGRINTIIVTSDGDGGILHSLEFGYTDKDGNSHRAGPFGTPVNTANVFEFRYDEDLIAVTGTFGIWSDITVITSLTFETNVKVYGPVGMVSGTSFSLSGGGGFDGFFGTSGYLLDSIGAILIQRP